MVKMHAGHIEINAEHDSNLFFWHFANRHIANKQRTVIWLNGGPGCSSEDGALMEIGPYRVKDKEHLEFNPGSWHEFANLLFVDNPVGTGFSYVNTDSFTHELTDMSSQFITFLEKFFELFPEYARDDIYIAGESYAGQHIPYISRAILDRNKSKSKDEAWVLKGMLIGNGWVSPLEQYMSYLPFAYKKGLVEEGSTSGKRLVAKQAECKTALDEGGKDHVDLPICETVLQEILRETQKTVNGEAHCYNMYDVRLDDTYPSCGMNWPPDLTSMTPYLRRDDVLDALHVKPGKRTGWSECNGQVGSEFRAGNSKPSIELLPDLIKEIPTILFSGAEDLICNHIGTENFIANMEWNGGKGFELSAGTWAPRRDWTFEGKAAGFYQEARNLTYILFYNSSHMVPFDYARRTRDMLDRFMQVDIASIGGIPTDSRIDGEKGLETSVGGHPNSTTAQETEAAKLEEAKWNAYYKSGEIVLVIVIIAAGAWAYYVWKDRRRRAGYSGIFGGSGNSLGSLADGTRNGIMRSGGALGAFARNKRRTGDIEARDFDESELDDLRVEGVGNDSRYSLGSGIASDDDGDDDDAGGGGEEQKRRVNGGVNGTVSRLENLLED